MSTFFILDLMFLFCENNNTIQNVQLTCQFSQECEQLYKYKIDFTLNNNGTTSQVSYFKEAL